MTQTLTLPIVASSGARPRACPLCDRAPARHRAAGAFARCAACGLVYRAATPAGDEVDYWTSYLDRRRERSYDELRRPYFRALWEHLRQVPRGAAGATPHQRRLLEVGCVPGHLLAEAADDGWIAHGVELSAPLCRLAGEHPAAVVWEGHVEAIDFGARRYDLIVISDAFRHFSRPLAGLRACAALLAPGGALVVREISAYHPRHARRLHRPQPFDWQLLTPVTARRFLEAAGLHAIELRNSPLALVSDRRLERLARRRPAAYRMLLSAANIAVRLADSAATFGAEPLTPIFLAIGRAEGPRASTPGTAAPR